MIQQQLVLQLQMMLYAVLIIESPIIIIADTPVPTHSPADSSEHIVGIVLVPFFFKFFQFIGRTCGNDGTIGRPRRVCRAPRHVFSHQETVMNLVVDGRRLTFCWRFFCRRIVQCGGDTLDE